MGELEWKTYQPPCGPFHHSDQRAWNWHRAVLGQWPYRRFPTTTSGSPTCDCKRICLPTSRNAWGTIWPHVVCLHLHHITCTPRLTGVTCVTSFHIISRRIMMFHINNVFYMFIPISYMFMVRRFTQGHNQYQADGKWPLESLPPQGETSDPVVSHGNPRAIEPGAQAATTEAGSKIPVPWYKISEIRIDMFE